MRIKMPVKGQKLDYLSGFNDECCDLDGITVGEVYRTKEVHGRKVIMVYGMNDYMGRPNLSEAIFYIVENGEPRNVFTVTDGYNMDLVFNDIVVIDGGSYMAMVDLRSGKFFC